jgi:hypothetical protein
MVIAPGFASAAATGASPASQASSVVTLPTGQQVALYGPQGAPTSFGPPPGVSWPASDPLTGATMNGHLYAIPRSAVPTLAGQLENFDLTRLAGGGAAPAASATPGTGTGTSAGTGTGTATGTGSSHNMWTLSINGLSPAGGPAYGVLIELINVDDAAKFSLITGFGVGPALFSVPQGNYSLVAVWSTFENGQEDSYNYVLPQFSVDADTSVVADFGQSTVTPSAAVSRPANLILKTLTVWREANKNGGIGLMTSDQPPYDSQPVKFFVNPTSPVTVGTLHYDTNWRFLSPDGGQSYTYDLDYPADGAIPAAQDHPADDSSLATINAQYSGDVPGQQAAACRTIVDNGLGFCVLTPLDFPAQRTEYVTASPDVHWQAETIGLYASLFEDFFADALRTYQPGSHVTETWLRQPLVPGVTQFAQPAYDPLVCGACRQGDNINLVIQPESDNSGHVEEHPNFFSTGPGDTETGSYQLSSGGTVLGTGEDPNGVQIPVPHAAAAYKLDYDVTRSAPWWTLSTSTHTEWTFDSGPNSANLPPGWLCDQLGDKQCYVLPLLFASYQLPTDMTGHEPAGPVTAQIGVHHLQGAPATAIKSVTMQVSFDNGQTWQQAGVTATGPGQYQVSYANRSGAQTASLWLTATDAQGNTISQVVNNAYAIAGS